MTYKLSIQSSPGIGPGTTKIVSADYAITFELDAARGPIYSLSVHNEEHLALCLVYFAHYVNPPEFFMALYRSEKFIKPGEDALIRHPSAETLAASLEHFAEPQLITALEKIIREDAISLGLHIP